MRRSLLLFFALLAWLPLPAAATGPFSDWAAIVVAGDWHSHSGAPSEVFDNGRHDIAATLARIGFAPGNMLQFSARSDKHPGTEHADKQALADGLWDLSNRTSGGCFFYLTSHGSPEGAVLGNGVLSPAGLAAMLDNACGNRPTVVFVAACYSGVFVRPLARPNRFVMTAARADRPSFGCGDNDRHTFFDECFLTSIAGAGDFLSLANAIRACVSRKEREIGADPSEPQLFVGAQFAASLPHWR